MTFNIERWLGAPMVVIVALANIAMVFIVGYVSLKDPSSSSWIEFILLCIGMAAFLVMTIILIPLIVTYRCVFTKLTTDVHNHLDDTKNRHITMTHFSKEVIISKDIFKTGKCWLCHRIEIYNHHKTNSYESYVYAMESSEGVSCADDYEFWLNDNDQPTKISNDKFRTYKREPQGDKCTDRDCKHGCEVEIPVAVQGSHHGKLKIYEKNCPCFSNLEDCPTEGIVVETIGLMVYYPTEVLQVSVRLDESVDGYTLKSGGICPDKSGTGSRDFKVIDHSKQRIEPYEHKLIDWGAIPVYSKDGKTITWEVHSPKVGYRYHLSFALVKDNIIQIKPTTTEKTEDGSLVSE